MWREEEKVHTSELRACCATITQRQSPSSVRHYGEEGWGEEGRRGRRGEREGKRGRKDHHGYHCWNKGTHISTEPLHWVSEHLVLHFLPLPDLLCLSLQRHSNTRDHTHTCDHTHATHHYCLVSIDGRLHVLLIRMSFLHVKYMLWSHTYVCMHVVVTCEVTCTCM